MAFLGPSLRRKKVIDRPVWRFLASAWISLAVHAGILLALFLAGLLATMVPKLVRPEKVELAQVSEKDWEQNRAIRRPGPGPAPGPVPALPRAEPPPPPPPQREERKKQVVDVAPSKDERPPDDARFLSERNSRVEKETRSRWQGTGKWRNRAPVPMAGEDRKRDGAGGADERAKQARQGQAGTNEQGGKGKRAPEALPTPDGDRVARLDPPTLPRTPRGPGDNEDGPGIPGLPGEPRGPKEPPGDPRLLPSLEDMSRIAAGPSNDALPTDIEEGEVTALNTKAYRFATFWNRFKQDVADHWFPGIRYEIDARDPDGATFGRSDRVTGLRIVLDGSGAVKSIEVVSPSGLDFLDRVAVKSVRDASPFYNVPRGLLDAKGELSFEFGFLVGGSRGVPVRPRWTPQ